MTDKELMQPTDEPLACDGSCEEHIGVTIPVIVETWGKFTYCETAIAEDRARGLVVNPIEQPKDEPTHKESLSVQKTAAWVGLTDDEIWSVYKQVDSMQYLEFSHAIETKLKEKNT